MDRPRHGENGWILEDMDWDPESGVATLEYSRYVPGVKEPEVVFITKQQPMLPTHEGWTAN